ncbi:hypothetical protein QBC38DRAFT_536036 [Podospora fimiseda]|uniref:Ankyrin repeat protein n=1 Tax=Podospora fimiseda TaxID=252190 RepID=A0AAN7BRB7_9PEZI|nr:hypothetical protein QBC38DRAFT_536036 [Podospora fimiseda]
MKESPQKRASKPKSPPNAAAWAVHRSNPSAFDPECAPATCLSASPHGPETIRDYLRHYFGCINIADRINYLEPCNEIWVYEYNQELEHLNSLPEFSSLSTSAKDHEAKKRVKKKIQSVAVALEGQYRRSYILRQALLKAPDPSTGSPKNLTKTAGHLVRRIDESRQNWKKSKEYVRGIELVRKWKHKPEEPPHLAAQRLDFEEERENIRKVVKEARNDQDPPPDDELEEYDLERDVNGYLIQYTLKKEIPSSQASRQSTTDPKAIMTEHETRTESPTRADFSTSFPGPGRTPSRANTVGSASSTHVTYMEPVDEELTDPRFKGRFPDQRIGMSSLLGLDKLDPDVSNILSRKECSSKDPTRLRYFHIPSNNMDWVEKTIARYYDEKQPDLSNTARDPPVRTHARMLLRPQFWRGQQHGARSGVVHARHMRPLCERISSEVNEIEDSPKNIVLFMPFLHWDTDRMRNKISNMIDAESEKQRKKHEETGVLNRQNRKDEREGLEKAGKQLTHPKEDPNLRLISLSRERGGLGLNTGAKDFSELVAKLKPVSRNGDDIKIDQNGRMEIKNKLGQYLIDAARLYEAMSTYRDQRMLEEYLYRDPPLHPRRTLDQSYYWTLRTTKVRDRDQVVYRGTNMNLDSCHRLEIKPQKDKSKCLLGGLPTRKSTKENAGAEANVGTGLNHGLQAQSSLPKERTSWLGRFSFTSRVATDGTQTDQACSNLQWTGHSIKTDEHGCDHCRGDIRKTSQVIMVDQLWMWVLDEKTIITSFPRRYGFNKQDLSGVHKSIRMRLKSARKNHIRSIYDLALIVLDECSNTFFDRTKTEDSQPQVMDIFSESIGNVTNQHTVCFQHVWHWTQKASAIYRSKSKYVDSSDLHVPLLDIHPEGKLQREVKDIIDELDIMINVHQKQKEVIRRFCKHVERILDPEGRWPDGADRQDRQDFRIPRAPRNTMDTTLNEPRLMAKLEENMKRKERHDQLSWFRLQSHELLAEVDDRLDELEGLKKGAESTAKSVNDLLQLKQQQASVVQAWESVKQAEEAVRQGRAIMMFTVMTIIFLPMSFISSIFGMNNREFGGSDNPWSVKDQVLLYILPISFLVILLSITIAFSNLLRALLWSAFSLFKTWISVKCWIYWMWLDYREDACSTSIMKWTEEQVRKMKEAVEIQKRKKKRDQREKDEKNKKTKEGGTNDDGKEDNDAAGGWKKSKKQQQDIESGGRLSASREIPRVSNESTGGSQSGNGGNGRQARKRSSLDRKGSGGNGHLGVGGLGGDDPKVSGSTCVGPQISHQSFAGSEGVNGSDTKDR